MLNSSKTTNSPVFGRGLAAAAISIAVLVIYCLTANKQISADTSPGEDTSKTIAGPAGDGDWLPAKRGDFEIVCREEGELNPVKVTTLNFMRTGKLSYLVPEGTNVKKGDKIMALETKDLEDEFKQLNEDLATAERTLTEQEENRDMEIQRMANDVLATKDAAILAELTEKETLEHPLPTEKEEAANGLEGAQAHLAAAQADYENYMVIARAGFGTRIELEGKKLAVQKAEVELQRSKMKSRITLDGALPYDRDKVKLERIQAAMVLKIKELDNEDQVDVLKAKVKSAQNALSHLQRKVARRKVELERSVVLAPHDGIVVYRPVEGLGNRKIDLGEYVWPSLGIVDLPSYEKMKVKTQVPESFIARLKVRSEGQDSTPLVEGTKARVTINTLSDRLYSGEVIRIDGWARDRNEKLSEADIKAQGLSGVRVFAVEVELDQSDPQRLREGFRATVEFTGDVLKDVIAIPIRAVTRNQGITSVRVLDQNAPVWRAVELGVRSLDRVVVLSGLNEGEQILVPREPPKPVARKVPIPTDDSKSSRGQSRGGSSNGVGIWKKERS